MREESPTGLYWSIRGTVLCQEHIKELDDTRWKDERWTAVPQRSQGKYGAFYQCQRCDPDGLAVAHQRQAG